MSSVEDDCGVGDGIIPKTELIGTELIELK